MALGPYAFSSLFNTDESSRGECWKTMGLTLPPLLYPPIYPTPPPGRGQRMGKPIIFQNVISLFLPISHLDWIQIPWLPVSLLAKTPNVNSKLTFFFFLLLYLTSIPSSLLTFFLYQMGLNEFWSLRLSIWLLLSAFKGADRLQVHWDVWRCFMDSRH